MEKAKPERSTAAVAHSPVRLDFGDDPDAVVQSEMVSIIQGYKGGEPGQMPAETNTLFVLTWRNGCKWPKRDIIGTHCVFLVSSIS